MGISEAEYVTRIQIIKGFVCSDKELKHPSVSNGESLMKSHKRDTTRLQPKEVKAISCSWCPERER